MRYRLTDGPTMASRSLAAILAPGIMAVLLMTWLLSVPAALGQGVALRAVSAVSEGMGGAGVAAPLDAAGAIHCNPASITGLNSSEMTFGMGLILPDTEVASRVNANALGPGVPGATMSGSSNSEPGAIPVPCMAFVHQVANSPWTYGLGIYGIGGSRVNYSASSTNPVLTPQPPYGIGLGRLSAEVDIVQIAPTAAYALDEHWSVGFAPTVTMAKLIASPLFLGPAYGAYDNYSSGVGTRYAWGGGCQAGVYTVTDLGWHFGATIKSPQWMEPFRYKSEDNLGHARTVTYDLDYPLIASLGTAYSGFEAWVFACDVRYFDYANAQGFQDRGYGSEGELLGLGWRSIFSVCFGVQRQISEKLYLRAGYCFNENPISSSSAMYNVASPLIIQHTLHTGLSYTFAENWSVALSYVHCFENSVSGPWRTAHGNLAGTSITSTAAADEAGLQISKRF